MDNMREGAKGAPFVTATTSLDNIHAVSSANLLSSGGDPLEARKHDEDPPAQAQKGPAPPRT